MLAILVSYVVENGTYEGSAERLIDFWNYLSKESIVETNPFFKHWWDNWHIINKSVEQEKAARRYYSAKEFVISGVPNVFSPLAPLPDNKFFDSYNNTWYRFNNAAAKAESRTLCKIPYSNRS